MLEVLIKNLFINTKEPKLLLKDIHFVLPKNKIYTILGKNGVGKSTLIKSLTRLLDKDIYSVDSQVFFEGKDLYSLNYNELMEIRKNKIKYVFQDTINSFDPLKKFEFYFKKLAKNKNDIDILLEYFILPKSKELFKLYPYEVSGGMAQRISFVISLLTEPELIILDEPTSGTDAAISNLFLLKLNEFVGKNNNAVLLVTQNLFFAEQVSDKISYLSNKTLTEFYSAEDFFNPEDLSHSEVNREIKLFLAAQKELS